MATQTKAKNRAIYLRIKNDPEKWSAYLERKRREARLRASKMPPKEPKICNFDSKAYARSRYLKIKSDPIMWMAFRQRAKEWKKKNPDKLSASRKRYSTKNKDKILAYQQRPDVKERIKKYRATVLKEHLKTYARNRARLMRKTSVEYRILLNCRRRLCKAARGICMSETTKELLGCNISDLKAHLESLWSDGMSWDNYGPFGWHIDHRVPCAEFDLTKIDQRKMCFHYTNLQPLWAKDNHSKSDKLIYCND
jgi:hypothetical protein